MNPYVDYVKTVAAHVDAGKQLPLGGFDPCEQKALAPDAPIALLFSPHPDDECITGLLPLRLMREAGIKIINVPVTFGSNKERQAARAEELKNACEFLGWEIYPRSGFQPLEKSDAVGILKTTRPRVVFMPHAGDWNSRHISTHHLVMDALAEMPADFCCSVIETEYWGAMDNPNLMVEADAKTVADLVAALSFHVKEVERNPYHITAPAWMIDNVRRGGELVGGQGGAAPDFTFATLYRLRRWENGKLIQTLKQGQMISMTGNVNNLWGKRICTEGKRV
jgi:N-acetylglucosamine malate deacetylase 1